MDKFNNDEWRIIGINDEVLSGDSNKIKLKMVSYAVIMEVQEAYMKQEISEKEEEAKKLKEKMAASKLDKSEKREILSNIKKLNTELKSMYDTLLKFSEARIRFNDIARRALRLPEENFKHLVNDGWIEIEGNDNEKEKISLEEMQSSLDSAQNAMVNKAGDDIFSSVDTEAIRQAVEETMNEPFKDNKTYGEALVGELSKDSAKDSVFDDAIKDVGKVVKGEVEKAKEDEIKPVDTDSIFAGEFAANQGPISISPEPEPNPIDISGYTDEKEVGKTNGDVIYLSGEERLGLPQKDDGIKENKDTNSNNPVLEPIPSNNSSQEVPSAPSVETDGSISFDFSDDDELEELNRQISEAQGSLNKSKELLDVKNGVALDLKKQEEAKKAEADDKLIRAERIRTLVREQEIAKRKAELQKLKEQLVATNEEIKVQDAYINESNSKIKEYNDSIAQSDRIINSASSQISGEGGRKL